MKSLGDALALRNRLIALLEEADTECCAGSRTVRDVGAMSAAVGADDARGEARESRRGR